MSANSGDKTSKDPDAFPGFANTNKALDTFAGRNQVIPPPPPTAEERKYLEDSDIRGFPTSYARSSNAVQAGSLHPNQKRMTLTKMSIVGADAKISDDVLTVHYNPESVQKTVASEYIASLDEPGVRTERYAFKRGKATSWNMTILLSTWGDEFRRRSNDTKTVDESLTWLEEAVRPSGKNIFGVRNKGGSLSKLEGPPPILVNLFNRTFLAYLQQAQIRYMKLSPESGEPVWAEVALSFIEFVNSSI